MFPESLVLVEVVYQVPYFFSGKGISDTDQWRLVHYIQWFNELSRNFPVSLIYDHFNNSASNFSQLR